jgi:predicted nucleic acid-binding Zn ribbon protein
MTPPRRRCLCCGADREENKYLCSTCWKRIPAPERRKLSKRDVLAGVRLLEMSKQFGRSVPPEEIKVSA